MALREKKNVLGMILCLFGIVIASIIMEVFNTPSYITIVAMAIGAFLFFEPQRKINIQRLKRLSLPMIYLIIVSIMGIASGYSGSYSPVVYVVYSLAIAVFALIHNANSYNDDMFVRCLWWTTAVFSIVLIPLLTKNFTSFSIIVSLSNGSDRLTLASIATAYLIVFLVYKPSNKVENAVRWIAFVAALLDVLLCNVRRSLLAYSIVLVLHYFKSLSERNLKRDFKVLVRILIVLIAIVVVFSRVELFRSMINRLLDGARSVTLGYMGKEGGIYNSGAIRNSNLSAMWHEYSHEYTFSELITGKGYMYKHLDLPFFQAFTDLGFFLGVLYFVVQFILPVKYIFISSKLRGQRFLQYYAASVLLTNFYSGTPYGHDKFIPVLFLILLTSYSMGEKKNGNKNCNS